MSGRPTLVDVPPLHSLPDALLVDSSVLIGIGRSTPERRRLSSHTQSSDTQLYVSTGVIEELDMEWAGPYGVNDWLDPIRNEGWIVRLPEPDYGARIRDSPTVAEMVDDAHSELAKIEQEREDQLPKTDAKFAGNLVQILVSEGCESVGLLIDDRNAERVLSEVIEGTDYASSFRILRGPEVLEHLENIE
jgi:hypothetical protein